MLPDRNRWFSRLVLACVAAACASCAGVTPLYPSRPAATPGDPITDPTPSRIVVHTTVTRNALRKAIETNLPSTGEGTVPILGKDRKFAWKRDAVGLRFEKSRIGLDVHLLASLELPVSSMEFPLDLRVIAEPVITAGYVARLQSAEVTVTSTDSRLRLANLAAGALEKIQRTVQGQVEAFSYDLRPTLASVYDRVDKPIDLPLGEATGCADLKVLGVEAGPTVLADGIEKDLALIVAPSITLPCAKAPDAKAELPALANVATLQGGPFTVSIPIAARYEELAKAMNLAFTDGKLYFSKEFPNLYMETPEVYAAKDQLVLKLHVAGTVRKFLWDSEINGDIYFSGHPTVQDNEIRVPDLEPTVETKNVLLTLKASLDGNAIRDDARAALRLDIGEKVKAVRDKLSKDLEFGDGQGCMKAAADKIEVTGVHAHGSYLRVYVAVTGRASVSMPCESASNPGPEAKNE